MYHVRKEGRKEGGEWGRACMHPRTQGRGEGRLSSWHTWESGDKHADKGGRVRDRQMENKWGEGGGGSAARTRLPASRLPCCETQLSARGCPHKKGSGRRCPVKTFTFLLLPRYYSQKAADHCVNRRQNIIFDKISTYIECTEAHSRCGPASNVNEDTKRLEGWGGG